MVSVSTVAPFQLIDESGWDPTFMHAICPGLYSLVEWEFPDGRALQINHTSRLTTQRAIRTLFAHCPPHGEWQIVEYRRNIDIGYQNRWFHRLRVWQPS